MIAGHHIGPSILLILCTHILLVPTLRTHLQSCREDLHAAQLELRNTLDRWYVMASQALLSLPIITNPCYNLNLLTSNTSYITTPLHFIYFHSSRESEKSLHEELKASLVAEGAARVTDVTHQLDRCKADLVDRDTEMGTETATITTNTTTVMCLFIHTDI